MTLAPTHQSHLRTAIVKALTSVDTAVHDCISAGQLLTDLKNGSDHGHWCDYVKKEIVPNIEVSVQTLRTWMRAAANVAKSLPPPPALDIQAETISISDILRLPVADLPQAAQDWKQLWLDFTEGKTIKQCLSSVVVDGDPDHRIDRAINGKTKGGAGGDRKDFPLFIARKLRDAGTHLSHWETMDHTQRMEVLDAFTAAIQGDASTLRGRGRVEFAAWPDELCATVAEIIKRRTKKQRP